MTRASVETDPITRRRPTRSPGFIAFGALAAAALLLGACGGDDDDGAEGSTTTTAAVPVAPTTLAPATTTIAPTTTTTIVYDTEGATLVVANASGINGAAGRMSDSLAVAGFNMGEATNSSQAVGQLQTSQVYYDPTNERALPVATSAREALGGGDIELLELGVPAPVESGEIGDATVLVMMGNDIADKSLAELQGRVAPSTTTPDDGTAPETTVDTPDETTPEDTTPEDTSPEDSSPEDSTPEDTSPDTTEG